MAVSSFHALISSGTTPKLLACETDARFIGYGAMLMESFVAVMALVAASIDEPDSLRVEHPAGRSGHYHAKPAHEMGSETRR